MLRETHVADDVRHDHPTLGVGVVDANSRPRPCHDHLVRHVAVLADAVADDGQSSDHLHVGRFQLGNKLKAVS